MAVYSACEWTDGVGWSRSQSFDESQHRTDETRQNVRHTTIEFILIKRNPEVKTPFKGNDWLAAQPVQTALRHVLTMMGRMGLCTVPDGC